MKVYSNSELLKLCRVQEKDFMENYQRNFPELLKKADEAMSLQGTLMCEPKSLDRLKIYLDNYQGGSIAIIADFSSEELYWAEIYHYYQNISFLDFE